MAHIASVGTSVPPFRVEQHQIRDAVLSHFRQGLTETSRLISVFDNVEVETRFLCVPLEWFENDHSFEEKNELYLRWAEDLSFEAIEECLDKSQTQPEEVDHLVLVSTSGMATPSLDARLISRLGMSPNTRRTPVFGLGCAGGAAGLAHCATLARANPTSKILLVAVEVSSLTFQPDDFRKSNLVATSLFSDGAAATLISSEPADTAGPEILGTRSTLWPNTLDVMGWEFTHTGLKVVFSRGIPQLVQQNFKQNIESFLRDFALQISDLSHFVLHPGGAKILAAYERSLELNGNHLDHSRFVLNKFGNMSSPTVLFILKRFMELTSVQSSEYGICAAFGPGFSSELLLLRW